MATFNGRNWTIADMVPFNYVKNWDPFWDDVIAEMEARGEGISDSVSAAAQSATSAGVARDIVLTAVAEANAANDLALTYRNESRDARDEAEDARDAAAGYAAGLHLPAITGADAGKTLKVKPDGSGYELTSSGVSLAQLHALAFS